MKTILIIVPYENVYPPYNGGMQRCFHILHQLAKHFELTAIIFQDKESFLKAANDYPEIKNIKLYSTKEESNPKDIFSLFSKKIEMGLRYRWIKKSWRATADGNFLQYYPVLKRLLKRNVYDAVILENLATMNAVTTIRKYGGNIKIIYDAHNVDSKLGAMAVEKFGMSRDYLKSIQETERTMHKTVNALFTCSKEDRNDFLEMNEGKIPVGIIPNGVKVGDIFDNTVKEDKPGSVLFCGSLHSPPNSEGLYWFYKNCWNNVKEQFPNIKLLVVGSGTAPGYLDEMYKDESVIFSGAVEDVKPWYNKAAIAVVPLLTGSGTRLKILEAMSLGVPVISTALGAEGIEYTDKQDIEIFDNPERFSNGIIELLNNKSRRIHLKDNARKLVVKKYDWNVIGEKMNDFLKETLN